MKNIDWFVENYIENKNLCEFLIKKFVKIYPLTSTQIYEGCVEFKKEDNSKCLLETHIKLLGEMTNVGIDSSIAGVKIREALIESKFKTK